MITELTQEQKDKFPFYVKKWIDIGINTENPSYDDTLEIANSFRELIEMKKIDHLIIAENPIEAWVICTLHELKVPFENLIDEMKDVFNGNPKKWEIPSASLPYQTGSFFVSIFSFYDYFISELKIEIEPTLLEKYKVWEKTSQIGMIYPLENLTVVCKKPLEIHLNENNVLHKDGGAALSYGGLGDFKIYSLNGVYVPDWLALTPSHQIDIKKYNDIENADVKAEFVRKVGVERFTDLGKKIDSYENYDEKEFDWWHKSQYELVDMKFLYPSFDYAPHLKMTNQTTGIYHVEAVSPDCRTLRDAIKERFGGKEMKILAIA